MSVVFCQSAGRGVTHVGAVIAPYVAATVATPGGLGSTTFPALPGTIEAGQPGFLSLRPQAPAPSPVGFSGHGVNRASCPEGASGRLEVSAAAVGLPGSVPVAAETTTRSTVAKGDFAHAVTVWRSVSDAALAALTDGGEAVGGTASGAARAFVRRERDGGSPHAGSNQPSVSDSRGLAQRLGATSQSGAYDMGDTSHRSIDKVRPDMQAELDERVYSLLVVEDMRWDNPLWWLRDGAITDFLAAQARA